MSVRPATAQKPVTSKLATTTTTATKPASTPVAALGGGATAADAISTNPAVRAHGGSSTYQPAQGANSRPTVLQTSSYSLSNAALLNGASTSASGTAGGSEPAPVLKGPEVSFGLGDRLRGKARVYSDIKAIDWLKAQQNGSAPKLNTNFENNLFKYWIKGSGKPYNLTGGEMAYLGQNKAVQDVSAALQNSQFRNDLNTKPVGAEVGPQILVPNSTVKTTRAQAVHLSNGEKGYAVPIAFYGSVPGKDVPNPLDGSLGTATAYFDSNGKFVGIADSYDFKHGNAQDRTIDGLGRGVGAKNFLVTGGVVADGDQAVRVQ